MHWPAIAVLALMCGGCELAEVATPVGGQDLVVVEAVLRAGERRQTMLLHRTLDGRYAGGVPGARVSVTAPDGSMILLVEEDPAHCADVGNGITEDSLRIQPSCYISPETDFAWVNPASTYELRVQTADGRQLQGRTRVPGAFTFHVPSSQPNPGGVWVCRLPPGEALTLSWSRSPGAWVYLADIQISGLRRALQGQGFDQIPEPLQLTGLSISETDTTLVLPTDFGVFERADYDPKLLQVLQTGFPEGVVVRATIAAMDRNFVNAVRGGGFNPSGNVRVSSIVGDGVGLFGSLVKLKLRVDVDRGSSAPECT